MKKLLIIVVGLVFSLSCSTRAEEQAKTGTVKLETLNDKASYSFAFSLGKNLSKDGIELNLPAYMKGLEDGLAGGEPLISEEEMRTVMQEFQKQQAAKAQKQREALGEKNKKEGEAFLEANKKKKGVVVLPSGLQYEVIKAGDGPSPTADDKVTVNYRGTLIDGTQFDSSYDRGKPATFPVTGVIPGWTEALEHMKVGAKWKLFVPPDLAYGERGAGAKIGPNATLIFEVELLSIEEKK